MVNPGLIIIIIISGVVIAGIIGSISDDWFGGLRIENLPDKITAKVFDKPEITLNFKNHGSDDIQNFNLIINTTHSSKAYLKITNIPFNYVIGDGGTREEIIKPISILQDEGSKLWYTLNFYLYANGEFEKEYLIPLVIEYDSPSFPPYRESNNNEALIFSEVSTTLLELYGDKQEEKTIELRVKNEKGGSFGDIRIVYYIENHNGEFLKIDGHEEDEELKTSGESTGTIVIPIKALKSVGDKIEYRVQLVLFNGNTQMDTEMIDVIIIPD